MLKAMFRRFPQLVLIASTLVGSWLGMQAVHELGHVAGALATRGRVARVVLHPLTISRTDLAENPQPLIVVWSGPLLGVALPCVVWAVLAKLRLRGAYLARFFAGFCLIANGAYIGFGSFEHLGDAGDMLRHGSPVWMLWLFGVLTVPAGLWLWHGQGRHFALMSNGQVDIDVTFIAAVLCLMLIALGFVIGGS